MPGAGNVLVNGTDNERHWPMDQTQSNREIVCVCVCRGQGRCRKNRGVINGKLEGGRKK